MLRTMRFAIRRLRRTPVLAVGSVVILATTIGGCAVALSAWMTLRSEGSGMRAPQSLASLWVADSTCPACVQAVPLATLHDWTRTERGPFARVAGFAETSVTAELPEQARWHLGVVVGDLFGVLGSQAARGRLLGPGSPGGVGGNEAVISRALWVGYFGHRSDVVGRAITMHGISYQIVGVLAAAPGMASEIDLWVAAGSLPPDRLPTRYQVIGRARSAQTTAGIRQLSGTLKPEDRGTRMVAVPVGSDPADTARVVRLEIALGALAMVFLIGCANFSGLYLARAISSAGELDIRAALGASRAELCSVVVSEIAVVAVTAATLVLGAALVFGTDVQALVSAELGVRAYQVDVRTVVAVVALCLAAIVGLAMAPVVFVSRRKEYDTLGGASRSGGTRRQLRVQSLLVGLETTLSLVLLIGAVLLSRSYDYARHFAVGFDPARVVNTVVDASAAGGDSRDAAARLDGVLAELSRALGAGSVAAWHQTATTRDDGKPAFTREALGETSTRLTWPPVTPSLSIDASPDFFRVLGIPVVAGRGFRKSDIGSSAPVAILNQVAADGLWPGQNALGKRLKMGPAGSPSVWMTIVGIVGSSGIPTQGGFAGAVTSERHATPLLFRPLAQAGLSWRNPTGPATTDVQFVARTDSRHRLPIGIAMDSVISSMIPGAIAQHAAALDARMFSSSPFQRVEAISRLLTLIAGLGMALVLLGFLTQTLDRVARRRREFAIRSALGATPRRLLFDVVRQSVTLAISSVAAGIVASALLRIWLRPILDGPTRLIHIGLLYGVNSADWRSYAAAIVLTVVVASVAAVIPAARFVGANPARSLY